MNRSSSKFARVMICLSAIGLSGGLAGCGAVSGVGSLVNRLTPQGAQATDLRPPQKIAVAVAPLPDPVPMAPGQVAPVQQAIAPPLIQNIPVQPLPPVQQVQPVQQVPQVQPVQSARPIPAEPSVQPTSPLGILSAQHSL